MQSSNPRPTGEYPATELRQALRAATSEIHALLHLHTGFAAIQNGTIDLVDYRSLLARLYGFHVSFEAAAGIPRDRSAWLQDDMTAVGMSDQMLAKIPRCAGPTTVDTPARRLGALYVVEGSTLGGRQLARHLDPLLGTTGSAGRRFFLGRGAETNTVWNAFLAQMALLANTPADRQDAVEAAVQTFGIFQEWLGGWRDLAV